MFPRIFVQVFLGKLRHRLRQRWLTNCKLLPLERGSSHQEAGRSTRLHKEQPLFKRNNNSMASGITRTRLLERGRNTGTALKLINEVALEIPIIIRSHVAIMISPRTGPAVISPATPSVQGIIVSMNSRMHGLLTRARKSRELTS